jgi:hypothetical protein
LGLESADAYCWMSVMFVEALYLSLRKGMPLAFESSARKYMPVGLFFGREQPGRA